MNESLIITAAGASHGNTVRSNTQSALYLPIILDHVVPLWHGYGTGEVSAVGAIIAVISITAVAQILIQLIYSLAHQLIFRATLENVIAFVYTDSERLPFF